MNCTNNHNDCNTYVTFPARIFLWGAAPDKVSIIYNTLKKCCNLPIEVISVWLHTVFAQPCQPNHKMFVDGCFVLDQFESSTSCLLVSFRHIPSLNINRRSMSAPVFYLSNIFYNFFFFFFLINR